MGKVTCVECKGTRCWKKGGVPTRTGVKQRYICFDCGRSFYLVEKKVATPEPKKKK